MNYLNLSNIHPGTIAAGVIAVYAVCLVVMRVSTGTWPWR